MQLRKMAVVAAFFGLVACGPAVAQDGGKIGVVRIQDVFAKYQKTADTKTAMEKEFDSNKKRIDSIAEHIKQMKEKIEKELPTAPRGSMQWYMSMQNIQTEEFRLKTEKEEFQRVLNDRMVAFYKSLFADFQAACKEFAERNGYALIVRAADDELSNESHVGIQNEIGLKIVHYFATSMDISDQILNLMNKKYAAGEFKVVESAPAKAAAKPAGGR